MEVMFGMILVAELLLPRRCAVRLLLYAAARVLLLDVALGLLYVAMSMTYFCGTCIVLCWTSTVRLEKATEQEGKATCDNHEIFIFVHAETVSGRGVSFLLFAAVYLQKSALM